MKKYFWLKTASFSGLQTARRSSGLGTVSSMRPTGKRVSVPRARAFPIFILLDMMLPKLSGLDVLRALKSDVLAKHIPVIVLSGLGQANEARLLKDGAAAFFTKSEKSLENSSLALIKAVESVLTATKA